MKKTIITIMAAFAAITMSAQTVNVHFKNGQTVRFNSSNVDHVDFSEKAPDPTVSAGAVVDLGLSVYWCSCNVGAESPEEYGDYFAWGETKPKSKYNGKTYSYYDSNKAQYIDIGEDIAGTEYDAATVNLGSDWRMPTADEMSELLKECSWKWSQIGGNNGYVVTGPSGNSIFIPAAGFSGSYNVGEWVYYYTSSSNSDKGATILLKQYNDIKIAKDQFKYEGASIRPVTTNPNAEGGPVDHSQDYLVTDKISAAFTGGAYSSTNGVINGGSQLNVKFTNGSSETVTLVGIQLVDGTTSTAGNNLLESEVEVPAGESKDYTVTVGYAGINKPIIRFTYRYNRKKYTVDGNWNL